MGPSLKEMSSGTCGMEYLTQPGAPQLTTGQDKRCTSCPARPMELAPLSLSQSLGENEMDEAVQQIQQLPFLHRIDRPRQALLQPGSRLRLSARRPGGGLLLQQSQEGRATARRGAVQPGLGDGARHPRARSGDKRAGGLGTKVCWRAASSSSAGPRENL